MARIDVPRVEGEDGGEDRQGALFPLVVDTVALWLDKTGDIALGRACPFPVWL